MSRVRDTIYAMIAMTTLIAASAAVPALADEVTAGSDDTVARQELVVASSVRETGPASETLAATRIAVVPPAAPAKPRAVRAVQPAPVRAAAASQQHWGCSGSWCGRQFVLMLGIGY